MEMQELGYNYRLTDIQAALGISQLNRADENLQKERDASEKVLGELHRRQRLAWSSGAENGASQPAGMTSRKPRSSAELCRLTAVLRRQSATA
jgi:dTDP-4-amino-4,6-dideoxygalactose transaminase